MEYLSIKYGDEYMRANAQGKIMRSNDGFRTLSVHPSNSWRIVGAIRYNNFGNVAETFTLEDIIAGGIQWKHANGKQRVYIQDFDHGSHRQWMSPAHTVTPVGNKVQA